MDAEVLAKCSEGAEEGIVRWTLGGISWRRWQMACALREKSGFDR